MYAAYTTIGGQPSEALSSGLGLQRPSLRCLHLIYTARHPYLQGSPFRGVLGTVSIMTLTGLLCWWHKGQHNWKLQASWRLNLVGFWPSRRQAGQTVADVFMTYAKNLLQRGLNFLSLAVQFLHFWICLHPSTVWHKGYYFQDSMAQEFPIYLPLVMGRPLFNLRTLLWQVGELYPSGLCHSIGGFHGTTEYL